MDEQKRAADLIKKWDESGAEKTSAYYRILGVALRGSARATA
jgi:hypothetical protein